MGGMDPRMRGDMRGGFPGMMDGPGGRPGMMDDRMGGRGDDRMRGGGSFAMGDDAADGMEPLPQRPRRAFGVKSRESAGGAGGAGGVGGAPPADSAAAAPGEGPPHGGTTIVSRTVGLTSGFLGPSDLGVLRT